MLTTDMTAFLSSEAGLVALQGNRLYPLSLPQEPILPATTYQQVSSRPEQDHQGDVLYDLPRYQFDCYAATYLAAKQLAAALAQAMTAWHNAQPQYAAFRDGELDIVEPELARYRVQIDFLIEVEGGS